nr:putative reverse transcriptase domain-containing protein [Tanacetum cinerariifolium]
DPHPQPTTAVAATGKAAAAAVVAAVVWEDGETRKKSLADRNCKPMKFQVGDMVMLKVSPWKGVIRFGKRGKLNPRYIGPFKRCYADEPLAISLDEIQIDDKLNFIEEPGKIMDRKVKQLNKAVSILLRCIGIQGEVLNSIGNAKTK